MHKRDFIKLTGMVAAGTVIAPTLTFCGNAPEPEKSETETDEVTATEFTLPVLPYAYDALEPHIDARTMEIHHSKHHAGYTTKLNDALAGNNDFKGKTINEILASLKDNDDHTAIRNNGGGYYNHKLFWEVMGPNGGGAPSGNVAEAINQNFGSYDAFKEEFTKAASTVFGSGWAWLCADGSKKLYISATPNQDNPLMKNLAENPGTPILGLDVWEHAYYLKHQNKRPDYIESFYNVINWDKVNENLAAVS